MTHEERDIITEDVNELATILRDAFTEESLRNAEEEAKKTAMNILLTLTNGEPPDEIINEVFYQVTGEVLL